MWLPMLTLINVFLHLYRQPIKFSCLDYNLGHTIGDLQRFSSGSIRQKKNGTWKTEYLVQYALYTSLLTIYRTT